MVIMISHEIPGEVSIIGLGDMGTSLVKTLLRSGYRVTVWNRTSSKAEPLVSEGAILAPSPAVAINASPIIIICVSGYKASNSILESEEVVSVLPGRLLIQLSGGTPQDARESEAWAIEQKAEYIDGAILATPAQIGMPETTIFVSGAEPSFQKSQSLLKCLAGNLQYLGVSVGAAIAWELGFMSYLWGSMLGFFHGARIFESEGIPVDALGSMIINIAPLIGEMIKHESSVIQAEAYETPQSTLRVSSLSVELIVKQAREAGINSDIPTFVLRLFRKALEAGYGELEIGALIKVLREAT
ncbi:uncharacterized protein VTP21DRAFT_7640 [Calcarisporiella thermophila]|uniref:uncharacterized protein n=1 Tax=Calcarisporiella thermophila TaxID=911321 RepID=UPI00374204F3